MANNNQHWQNSYAKKLRDLEFHYSAGPTRCAVPPQNLRMLQLPDASELSTTRSISSYTTTSSRRSQSTGRISSGRPTPSIVSGSSMRSSRTGSSVNSIYREQRVEKLEEQLASVQSQRKQAQNQLSRTSEELNRLEQFIIHSERDKNK
jgi:uncharacterized phage infection (PIP) family protein YhgE